MKRSLRKTPRCAAQNRTSRFLYRMRRENFWEGAGRTIILLRPRDGSYHFIHFLPIAHLITPLAVPSLNYISVIENRCKIFATQSACLVYI